MNKITSIVKFISVQNPFIIFSPFLFVYVVYVLLNPTNGLEGDGSRYLTFANNLLNGYYSPPPPNINLWNGPGYPLFILPFVALGLPPLVITVVHAILHYLSIVIFFKSLRKIASLNTSLIVALFWGCYINAFQNMAILGTEIFSMFLINLFIYCLLNGFKSNFEIANKKYIYFAGLLFGFLILTKIIFGYVLIFMLIICFVLQLFNKRIAFFKMATTVFLIAMILNVPYLIYTHHLTNKWLYWGNSGGQSLYWMSTPYEDEFGDWKGELVQGTIDMGNFNIPNSKDTLLARHGKDYTAVYSLPPSLQDDEYKKIAIKNIKANPVKYTKNVIYNIGRLFFHYPFSYALPRAKTLFVIPLNAIIFTFLILSIFPTILNWRKINFSIKIILGVTILYLGFTILVSTYSRMLTVIAPCILIWIAYIFTNIVQLKINFNTKK